MAKTLKFYDLKANDYFETSKYDIKIRIVKGNKRKFAVTTSPITKNKYWRVLPKNF